MSMIVGRLVAQLDVQDTGFAAGMSRAEQSMQRANTQVTRTTGSINQFTSASTAASLRHAAAVQRQTLTEQKLTEARRSGKATQQELMRLEASATSARASAISTASRAATAQRQLAESNRAVSSSASQVITSTREQASGVNGLAVAAMKARTVLATMGITAGAATGVRFFTDAIGNARALGAQTNQLNIIFGESMGTIQTWAQGAVQAMSMSQRAAQGAAIDFATFGAAADMSGDQLSSFSMRLTELAADAASFYAVSPEKMIEDMTSAFAGQSRPMMKYGVLLQENTLKQAAYNAGITESVRELSQTERIQAVYVAMMEQMSITNGDVGRTSEAYGNKLKRLKAGFEETSAAIGQKIMPIAKAFVDLLAGPGLSALRGFGDVIGIAVQGLSLAASAFSSLPGPVQAALTALVGFRIAQKLLGSQFTAMGQQVGTARTTLTGYAGNLRTIATANGRVIQTSGMGAVAMGRFGSAIGQMGTHMSVVGRMQTAFMNAATQAGSFGRVAGTSAAAMTGLRAAGSGLAGVLGGPLGIAMIAAGAGLAIWQSKSRKAKQEAAEHEAVIDSLAGSFDKVSGAMSNAGRQKLNEEYSDKGTWERIKGNEQLTISMETLTDAAAGVEGAMDKANAELDKITATSIKSSGWWKTHGKTYEDAGVSLDVYTAALRGNGDAQDFARLKLMAADPLVEASMHNWSKLGEGLDQTGTDAIQTGKDLGDLATEADKARDKAMDLAEANGDVAKSLDGTKQAVGPMTDAMVEFEESTDGAASKVDKLGKVMKQLLDDSQTVQAAQQEWNDSIRDYIDQIGAVAEAGGIGIDAAGNIDTTTKAGSKLYDELMNVAYAFGGPVRAAFENARSSGADVATALDAARARAVELREAFISDTLNKGLVGTREEAEALADQVRMIPDQIVSQLHVFGVDEATKSLNELGLKAGAIPKGQFRLVDNTPEIRAKLDELKADYEEVDGKLVIDDNTGEVAAALNGLGIQTQELPDGWIKIEDNSPENVKRLKDLGLEVKALPDGSIFIAADDADFKLAVAEAIKTERKQVILEYRQQVRDQVAINGSGVPYSPEFIAGAQERSTGGPVYGQGTGTSDDIPAWLSHREFVHTAAATDYYGTGFMHAINERRIPRDKLPGFNTGGLVEVHQLANYMQGIGRGQYTWGGWGQGWDTDCSGGQSIAVEGAHGNMQPGTGERAATGSYSEYLPRRGYQIGRAPAGVGAHEIGWSPEHTAGTFYGKSGASVNFEMGGGTDTYADGKYGGNVGSRASQFPNQAYIILPDTYGIASGGSDVVKDVALTEQSSRDEVASKIIAEGRMRGYSDDQVAAILSMAIQENQLGTDNVFQQMDPSVYPGRDDPNTNVSGFYDALDGKRSSSGWSDDIWSNLFWVQQAPSAASAADAVANGRQEYLDEIKAHQEESAALVSKLGPAVGGTGGGGEFAGGTDGSSAEGSSSTPSEPPEDPTLFSFTVRNPFEPFWWRGEKEQRQHIIDEYKKQQAWDEYIRGSDGELKKVKVKSIPDAEKSLKDAEDKLHLATLRQSELKANASEAQRESARQAVERAEGKVASAKKDLDEARANPSGYRAEQSNADDVSRNVTRMAAGGTIPGVGSTDSVHLLGMPGEEIIRKDIAESPGMRQYLKAINRGEVKIPRFSDGGTVGFAGYADDDRDAMRPKNWNDWLGLAKGAAFTSYNTLDPYIQMGMTGQVDLGNMTPTINGGTTDTGYVSGVVSDVAGQISSQLQELIWAVKEGKDIRVVVESENRPQGFSEVALAGMSRGF